MTTEHQQRTNQRVVERLRKAASACVCVDGELGPRHDRYVCPFCADIRAAIERRTTRGDE